jgi:hypothetical protein
MLIIYWFSTSLLISIDGILKINKVFITLGFGFSIINILYSFLITKWNTTFNILLSIFIAIVSLFLALKFGDLHIFSKYDPYDILTSIISNAIFSIIFWEIAYQLKINHNRKNE